MPGAGAEQRADLLERLRARTPAEVTPSEGQLDASLDYLDLLTVWNRRINLTALSLVPPVPDSSLDRLIVEPLRAAPWIPNGSKWADLGSGGGSPAIPLKIVRPDAALHLVESRERKCAFLRHAIRNLRLMPATVHCARFEDLAAEGVAGGILDLDVVTIRAVRVDATLLDRVARCLRPGGRLVLFGEQPAGHPQFVIESVTDGLAVLMLS